MLEYALTRPEIDPHRIILLGKSLGGLLAPGAAAFEHRLAACIAVDGVYASIPTQYGKVIGAAAASLSDEQMSAFLEQEMEKNPNVQWAISQGMWTMQGNSLADVAQKMAQYNLAGLAGQITCPTLVCDAESDHAFAGQPRRLFDEAALPQNLSPLYRCGCRRRALPCRRHLLLNQRLFDR